MGTLRTDLYLCLPYKTHHHPKADVYKSVRAKSDVHKSDPERITLRNLIYINLIPQHHHNGVLLDSYVSIKVYVIHMSYIMGHICHTNVDAHMYDIFMIYAQISEKMCLIIANL